MINFFRNITLRKPKSFIGKTSGEIISELTDGANLVENKQTWEYSKSHKEDIEMMKRCCDAELKTMKAANIVPAPFYFLRVAILSRKYNNYMQEIEYCERYINAVEEFYNYSDNRNTADVRRGPVYKKIVARLPKAKKLLKKCPY